MIRYVENQDKEAWYVLDKHLPESTFDEKVRCRQGYVCVVDENLIKSWMILFVVTAGS